MVQEKNLLERLISSIDVWLVLAVFMLISISFFAIYSASFAYGLSFRYIFVQAVAVGIGLVCFLFLTSFNYQYYKHFSKVVYILSLMLLAAVLVFGSFKRGTKGWFDFGFISFQPVEITKIMFVLVLSAFLDIRVKMSKTLPFLISVFAILMGHLILIMMQPDFSSTLSYFPVTLVLLFVVGANPFYLFCIVVFGGLVVGIPLLDTFVNLQLKFIQDGTFFAKLAIFLKNDKNVICIIFSILVFIIGIWRFLWKLKIEIPIVYPVILCLAISLGSLASIPVEKSLKDYQRKRLIVFLNPNVDPKGAGYNIIQSKIAIGSGKILGKGFKKGTQTQLGFLPEQHTDFIFSVIGEEGGWLVSQATIIIYFIFIWRALVIAKESRDRYGSLIAIGIATMFAFYVVINIGMVMGMMPVTGMPLPLLSYGGSSILSSLCAIGVLCSINMRRYMYY
ncbi:MAG: rod shape-determining protein RodA [Endomicrobium sp.]|jgi:rod shape determining protein RodA|uniref:rod shape-determining protein RodA n=1 Tax=Candidatus Endomicrobiellum cubanum TaxID=3242325 RepID=UPI002825AC1D|nr:rod shape-determining protein RodA [Endomicrobium sp.]MDR2395403.1 rod shape-determining protein RodA [Endomicrobium sp.]